MRYTKQDLMELDRTDPLRTARDEFALPEGVIYLNGNSLGAMPKAAPERVKDFMEREWSTDLIRSWNKNDWFRAAYRTGDKIARLIGADSGEVVATDCVSVNLYKMVLSALHSFPGRSQILTETGNFPTDLYILKAIARDNEGVSLKTVADRTELTDAIDDETAIVVLTEVHYKTGHFLNPEPLIRKARDHGALVLLDLCHSGGAMPIRLNEIGADLAIGCTYKYMNGGPGSPGFIYVSKRLQNRMRQPIEGWYGHAAPFAMSDDFEPLEGIGRFLTSTQSVLALITMEVGIDVMLKYDMADIRTKSIKMGNILIELIKTGPFADQFDIVTPLDPEERGSQISIRHEKGYEIMQALIARGIIGDFRSPDIMRFGLAPLYIRYQDVYAVAETLTDILETGEWDRAEYKVRHAVT